jgi:hypothetical protein
MSLQVALRVGKVQGRLNSCPERMMVAPFRHLDSSLSIASSYSSSRKTGDFGKLQIGGVTPGTIAVLLSHMVHNL